MMQVCEYKQNPFFSGSIESIDTHLTEEEEAVIRKYCWRTLPTTWRSAFLLRFCLLRLGPDMAKQTLEAIYKYAYRNNDWLESNSLYQNLSTYDLVEEFNGLLFPGSLAQLTRFFRQLWDKIPEAAKFWIMVRTGTEQTWYSTRF